MSPPPAGNGYDHLSDREILLLTAQKVDWLSNELLEERLTRDTRCEAAADSRKALHVGVDEYRSDKRIVLCLVKYTGVIAPVAYGVILWLRKHGVHI